MLTGLGHQDLELGQGGEPGGDGFVLAVQLGRSVGGGEAGRAGLHGLGHHGPHLLDLGLGGLALGTGFAHHRPAYGRVADVAGHVHPEPPFPAGQEFGEGLEVPVDGGEGHRGHPLDLGEHPGQVVPLVGPVGRHREAAVPGQHGGDPVIAGRGGVGLEGELGVVVGVGVDDPGGHMETVGVDHLGRRRRG